MIESSTGAIPRPVVLLVDDEPALLDILVTELSKEFELDTARSANEAEVSMATRNYDAVVCDHMMHGEQGLDFLVRAKELHPGTLRILITAYINPDLISRSTAVAGLAACLIKPVRPAEISQAIRAVLQP
jgi:two-component system response regulator HupR/HoxA